MDRPSVGAQSLFVGMPHPIGTEEADKAMMNIIHDGGGYKDGQVDDS